MTLKKLKQYGFILIALALALTLVACGGDTEAPTEAPEEPAGEGEVTEPTDGEEAEPGDGEETGEREQVTLSMILVTPQERWDFLLERRSAV